MQTAQELRRQAAELRRQAIEAPDHSTYAGEMWQAAELDRKADAIEAGQVDAAALDAELRRTRASLNHADRRVAMLERIISQQIGMPLDRMSEVAIAFALSEPADRLDKLAGHINSAEGDEGLAALRRIVKNMGLPRILPGLADQFSALGLSVRTQA